MKKPPEIKNEEQRLKKLRDYEVLDTGTELEFDEITKFAAEFCHCKIALITLVDESRQWFKSKYGLAVNQTPRDISYCGHAIAGSDILIIEDAALDSRFSDNPLFLTEPHVRFYAGMPLVTADQFNIGTLCVIDSEPRKLSEYQIQTLKFLAKNVVSLLDLRIKNKYLKQVSTELEETKNLLQFALASGKIGTWVWQIGTNKVRFDEGWARLLGINYKDLEMNILEWTSRCHPDDLERAYSKMDKYINGTIPHFEDLQRIKNTNGKWLHLFTRGQIVKDKADNTATFIATVTDISELMAANAKLGLLFNHAPFGFAFCDMNGKFLEINPEFERITGRNINHINNLSYWDLTPDKYKDDEEIQLEKLEKFGVYGPYRKEYIKQDGTLVPVELSGFIVNDYDGIKGIWSVVKDISEELYLENEKRKVVEEINELNQKLDAILKFTPVGVYECELNKNWTMKFISSHMEEITGYSAAEILKDQLISFSEIILPADRNYVEEKILEAVSKDSSYDLNYRIRHKCGDIKWVWERGAKNNTSNTLIGVIFDITEKKQIEDVEALISGCRSLLINNQDDKEVLFKFVLDEIMERLNSSFGFVAQVLDSESENYLYIRSFKDTLDDNNSLNQNMKRNEPIKIILESLIGKSIESNNICYSSDCKQTVELDYVNTEKQKKFMSIPIIYNKKTCGVIFLSREKNDYSLREVRYLDHFFNFFGEILQALKTQEELERQKLIAHHQSKLALVGELAAGVGHEINNPLAILQGNLQVLHQHLQASNQLDDESSTRIAKSHISIERIAKIVKGLKSFARADSDENSSLDLKEVLGETEGLLSEIFKKEGIDIKFEVEGDLHLYGNRGRIQQVVVNLLTNARDAVSELDKKNIKVRVVSLNESIQITVEDSGCGIPENIKDRIFDPFFTTKEMNKGTGIGLALVSTIIKEHKGHIHVQQSQLGGAKFLIKLPLIRNIS